MLLTSHYFLTLCLSLLGRYELPDASYTEPEFISYIMPMYLATPSESLCPVKNKSQKCYHLTY